MLKNIGSKLLNLVPQRLKDLYENNPPCVFVRRYAGLRPHVWMNADGLVSVELKDHATGRIESDLGTLEAPKSAMGDAGLISAFLDGVEMGSVLAMRRVETVTTSELAAVMRSMRKHRKEEHARIKAEAQAAKQQDEERLATMSTPQQAAA